MNTMFPNTWHPHLSGSAGWGGYGAAQWTDYAPPPRWVGTAGYGASPAGTILVLGGAITALWGGAAYALWRMGRKRTIPRTVGYLGAGFAAWRGFSSAIATVALTGVASAQESMA